MEDKMHFDGQIWRPPFEADSILLQATIGCSHNNCKFCNLYNGTRFRVAPFDEIEHDLRVVQKYQSGARRVFLTGANPFVLTYGKLERIALAIHDHLPAVRTIGCFARITDIATKSDQELRELHRLGYDRLMIGIESGDDPTLEFMRKGFRAKDIVEQCLRLDGAGIEYNFFYLNGLAGRDNGRRNAMETAAVINQLRPACIEILSLTVFPDSGLWDDVQAGRYVESTEYERLEELKMLFENLHPASPVTVLANTVSNPVPITGQLPDDREELVRRIQSILDNVSEADLERYRKGIVSL